MEAAYEPERVGMVRSLSRDVILNVVLGSRFVPVAVRARALRLLGMAIGHDVLISPGSWFANRQVSLGDNCFVNRQCVFDSTAPITIGAGTELAMQVMLITSTHPIGSPDHRAGTPEVRPIVIGDGCWLGARVTVLPGVEIGAGCVIASGATVAADCAPNGLYGGVPARRIRDL